MPEPGHPLGPVADEDVGEVLRADALAGAVDRRERLLRRHGSVPAFGRLAAIVAIAAARPLAFAEIPEQDMAAARGGLAIADQRLDLLPLDAALARFELVGVEELQEIHHIGHAVG